MATADQRRDQRFKVAIRALVTDRAGGRPVACMIKDGSFSGCKIASRHIGQLPNEILVKVPEIARPIRGVMAWRTETEAGVRFEWTAAQQDERRSAPRQEVEIAAVVYDLEMRKLTDGTICDASRTGCRFSVPDMSVLPDFVYLQIRGLTGPVFANIVWKKEGFAGAELIWLDGSDARMV